MHIIITIFLLICTCDNFYIMAKTNFVLEKSHRDNNDIILCTILLNVLPKVTYMQKLSDGQLYSKVQHNHHSFHRTCNKLYDNACDV